MALPEGEYEIDLGAFDFDNGNGTSLGIKYNDEPKSMERSRTMNMYEEKMKIVLEGKDRNQDTVIFEGNADGDVGNGRRSMQDYYLTYSEEKGVVMNKLGRRIRVNKCKDESKWRHIIGEEKDIINESDFEDLGGDFPVFDFGEEEEKTDQEMKEKREKEKEKDRRDQELKEKRDQELKGKQLKEKKERDIKEKQLKEKKDKEMKEKLVEKLLKEKLFKQQQLKQQKAQKKPPSTPQTSGKSTLKHPPKDEDDFQDLEDQLQEVLQDSSDDQDNIINEPIIIKDQPQSQKVHVTSQPTKKPMSLRQFVGDNNDDDLSSSEEE